MLYRETGQFKTSYAADQAILPIRQDRIGLAAILLLAFVVVPLLANDYWLDTIMMPFLVFSIAAIGLNLLTGYAGQLSLGTGGFMAVRRLRRLQARDRLPRPAHRAWCSRWPG